MSGRDQTPGRTTTLTTNPAGTSRGRIWAASAALVLAVTLAACGGAGRAASGTVNAKSKSHPTTPATAPADKDVAPHAGANRPGETEIRPSASGEIASISGLTLEVQDPVTGQTTIDLTPKTAITAAVPAALAQITSGTCISVSGTKSVGGGLEANLVTISGSASGGCLEKGGSTRQNPGFVFGRGPHFGAGARFRSGTGKGGTTFTLPPNRASVFGKVTGVSGSAITVQGIVFSASGVGSFRATLKGTSPEIKAITVSVSSSTKYSKEGLVKATSLRVGECATAFGPANDIGAVTATRLLVTQPTTSGCSATFGTGRLGPGTFVGPPGAKGAPSA